jgi:hypothetical protein
MLAIINQVVTDTQVETCPLRLRYKATACQVAGIRPRQKVYDQWRQLQVTSIAVLPPAPSSSSRQEERFCFNSEQRGSAHNYKYTVDSGPGMRRILWCFFFAALPWHESGSSKPVSRQSGSRGSYDHNQGESTRSLHHRHNCAVFCRENWILHVSNELLSCHDSKRVYCGAMSWLAYRSARHVASKPQRST